MLGAASCRTELCGMYGNDARKRTTIFPPFGVDDGIAMKNERRAHEN
jgi:hypothetical protein